MPGPHRPRIHTAARACLAAVATIAAFAPPPTLGAQAPSPAPFSTLSLRAGALANVNRERLHDYWRPATGAELEVATPFPVGEIAVAVGRLPFRARAGAQPDFDATLVSLRWGLARPLAGPLAARAQLAVGDFLMSFADTAQASQGLTRESELLVGAGARLDLRVAHWLGASVGAAYHRVLTRVPIGLVTVDAGARLTAPTPRWLRGVLE